MDEDTVLVVPAATGVLGNDSDVEGDSFWLVSWSDTSNQHGVLELNEDDGSFVYTPPADFFGKVTFTYTITDGHPQSTGKATVTITVHNVNDPPDYQDPGNPLEVAAFQVAEDGVLGQTVGYDIDSVLTGVTISGPNHGSLTWHATWQNLFVYTPDPDFHGADSFTYRVHDGEYDSNVGTEGDGTISAAVIDQDESTLKANHSYAAGGIYTITVTLVDEDGGIAETIASTSVCYGRRISVPAVTSWLETTWEAPAC